MKLSKNMLGSIYLLPALLFMLSGCGNKQNGQENANAVESYKNSVFDEEEIVLQELDMDTITNMVYAGDHFYLNGTMYTVGKESEANSFYAVYTTAGDQISYQVILGTPDESDGKFTLGSNGDIYAITTKTIEEGETEDRKYTMEQFLTHRSQDGSEIDRVSIAQQETEQEYLYANAIFSDGNGKIQVVTNGGILEFDEKLQFLRLITVSEEIIDAVKLQDGTIVLICYGQDGQVIKQVNLQTNEVSEPIKTSTDISYESYPGTSYDLLITNQSGISGYNIMEGEITEIMNFVNSNADIYSIYDLISLNESQFYARYYGNTDKMTHIGKFTKVDPADVKDTIKLTMAGFLINSEVMSHVVNYNKSQDQYHIQVNDYYSYSTIDDYMAGLTKLNNDIIAGNVPDILILNSIMPTDSYIQKGLFVDLNPYLDGNNGIDRSQYLNNVLDAFNVDGKLYQLVPSFDVSTIIGKTSLVGEDQGWSFDRFMQVMSEMPEEMTAFSDVLRVDVLNRFLSVSNGEFLDKESNTCNFNSESFISFLTFLKELPDLYEDSTSYNDEEWSSMLQQYRNDQTLLQMVYMLNFTDYGEWEQGTFGEPVTFLGFPTNGANGSAIEAESSFAISARSDHKEAAWDFIKYFLGDEYQQTITMFPVSLSALQVLAVKAMERPSYVDENGNKVEYENSYWLGETEIKLEPMSQENVDKVMNMLTSLHQTIQDNEDVVAIITEEAAPFYSGEKSVQEVVQIIQSRVQLLLSQSD